MLVNANVWSANHTAETQHMQTSWMFSRHICSTCVMLSRTVCFPFWRLSLSQRPNIKSCSPFLHPRGIPSHWLSAVWPGQSLWSWCGLDFSAGRSLLPDLDAQGGAPPSSSCPACTRFSSKNWQRKHQTWRRTEQNSFRTWTKLIQHELLTLCYWFSQHSNVLMRPLNRLRRLTVLYHTQHAHTYADGRGLRVRLRHSRGVRLRLTLAIWTHQLSSHWAQMRSLCCRT